MSKKEIHFMGLLANTDKSILNVKLGCGFKIDAQSDIECVNLLSILEGLPSKEIYRKISFYLGCLSEEKLYYIDNSFESDTEMNNTGIQNRFVSAAMKFENHLIRGYLYPVIRLMRLFKEGNICMPLRYYYVIDNNTPKIVALYFSNVGYPIYSKEPYTLESSEIPVLQGFIQNAKLPFKEAFLNLAFETFELSYHTININLSFLSLMISLEALFNPGQGELRYRISRNTAVLLGNEKEDSKTIFSEIRKLYDKRSKVVHTGASDINQEDLLKLRRYVRESIKEVNKIGKNKDELLDLLNSRGFYKPKKSERTKNE